MMHRMQLISLAGMQMRMRFPVVRMLVKMELVPVRRPEPQNSKVMSMTPIRSVQKYNAQEIH